MAGAGEALRSKLRLKTPRRGLLLAFSILGLYGYNGKKMETATMGYIGFRV